MTDTSQFTGAHKNRFDESGRGRGKLGRRDSQAAIHDISQIMNDHKVDHSNQSLRKVGGKAAKKAKRKPQTQPREDPEADETEQDGDGHGIGQGELVRSGSPMGEGSLLVITEGEGSEESWSSTDTENKSDDEEDQQDEEAVLSRQL